MQYLKALLLSFCFASPVQAQEPAIPKTSQASTVPQRFNAAMALLSDGKPAEALVAFDHLESDLVQAAKPKASNLALVRVYKGHALHLLSRNSEAKAALSLAFESGILDAPANAPVRSDARTIMARVLLTEFDDAGAAELYRLLAQENVSVEKSADYLANAALLLAVLDPGRAIALATQAVGLVESQVKHDKTLLANAYRSLGRAQLNAGQLAEARASLKKAIAKTGGLDLNITYSEYATRSDAAITALRLNDKDEAREMLAFTGAGRTKVSFPTGIEMMPPSCGGVDGLTPEDMAIVEFAIGKDGKVTRPRPVFATRPGRIGYAFARAVNDWSWDPARVKEVDPFFLSAMRIEVRCTNSTNRKSILLEMRDTSFAWIDSRLGNSSAVRTSIERIATLTELRAKQAAKETKDNAVVGAVLALAVANSTQSSRDETQQGYLEAARQLRASGAPPSAWIYPTVLAAQTRVNPVQTARTLASLRDDPEIKADRASRAALGLVVAEFFARARKQNEERAILNDVITASGLSEKDPVRLAALLALANSSIAAGDADSAKAAYAQTGLSARQCAALDTQPIMLKSNISSNDFPMEAMQWGFEGWSRQEYDIGADGRTANVRTIASFPPAVFAQAAEDVVKAIRYRTSFRPDGGIGCGAVKTNMVFRLP